MKIMRGKRKKIFIILIITYLYTKLNRIIICTAPEEPIYQISDSYTENIDGLIPIEHSDEMNTYYTQNTLDSMYNTYSHGYTNEITSDYYLGACDIEHSCVNNTEYAPPEAPYYSWSDLPCTSTDNTSYQNIEEHTQAQINDSYLNTAGPSSSYIEYVPNTAYNTWENEEKTEPLTYSELYSGIAKEAPSYVIMQTIPDNNTYVNTGNEYTDTGYTDTATETSINYSNINIEDMCSERKKLCTGLGKEPKINILQNIKITPSIASTSKNLELNTNSNQDINSELIEICASMGVNTDAAQLETIVVKNYSTEYTNLMSSMKRYKSRSYASKNRSMQKNKKIHDSTKLSDYRYGNLRPVMRDFVKSKKTLWMVLYECKGHDIVKLIFNLEELSRNKEVADSIFAPVGLPYYSGFMYDLYEYLLKNTPSYYRPFFEGASCKKKSSVLHAMALGNIYIKRELNIGWCAESIFYIAYFLNKEIGGNLSKETKLKRQLHAILGIPEIYEDLFYMPRSMLEDIKCNVLEIDKDIPGLKLQDKPKFLECLMIVCYLSDKTQGDMNSMFFSYAAIERLAIKYDWYTYTDTQMYIEIYRVFCMFYNYVSAIYCMTKQDILKKSFGSSTTDISESVLPIKTQKDRPEFVFNKKHTPVPSNYRMLFLGKETIVSQMYVKCRIKIIKKEINYKGVDKKLRRICEPLTYCIGNYTAVQLSFHHHYHIQFVDNTRHRVHVVHLPFYTSKTNGTIEYLYVHTIKDIVEHLKSTFGIQTPEDSPFTNNVYPFKYNRNRKTWSLISDDITLSKTMLDMHNLKHDVIFYHIEENIKTTEFVFVQFNTISMDIYTDKILAISKLEIQNRKQIEDDKNGIKPRIPLFFSKFISSAVHLSPYWLKTTKYEVKQIDSYTDLVPVEFLHYLIKEITRFIKPYRIIELNNTFVYIKNYYTDFFIIGLMSKYEDCGCYSMNIIQETDNENEVILEWLTHLPTSIEEYTNYCLDLSHSFANSSSESSISSNSKNRTLNLFLNMLKRKSEFMDMVCYGLLVGNKVNENETGTFPIICPTIRHFISKLKNQLTMSIDKYVPIINNIEGMTDIVISVKNTNYTKSKLGIHYDICDIIFRSYTLNL
ncbi:hypothetical protein NEPAR06_0098 [Nematocida parisii]|uniref:Uncharacterized protein n=1 Tax=Nematocida parisii (strain ERTm3) TaxID=935791 RepID=I3EE74_NEMP3|nr:uncharacterized protein NEPG_00125 [Nematocida parisii ERTm1]EIJ87521.1 hypothetical protein NEQG_02402 [Nematocida parisii ERTm3]KAI5142788.1 hypothetical protein NEPAR07_0314 [Nematocida parisii]EIJ94603.1 hypothetical protein NEPG_00125 [Nematocida parisii ERTm1]KAI5152977.1 hypothetical protein NEPAR06_0098 [Nematocida parisii]KAI5157323.1 hypothetical protein NEPAR05_1188 [Nematocida parisii]|eukprot:XP_013057959.1 hypothetical protein NEPG_00125 [Nematocida parisii ERTm1]